MRKTKLNYNMRIRCPFCAMDNSFEVVQLGDWVPYFGDVIETLGKCAKCGHTSGDILFLDDEKIYKEKLKVKIDSEEKLSLRVIKSKSCKIEIPEIELVIEPGSHSEGFVTNVEGLVERIIENVKRFKGIHPEKEREILETIKRLENMKRGKEKFTIIFEDSNGRSIITKDEARHK